jgi:hypothetical protein
LPVLLGCAHTEQAPPRDERVVLAVDASPSPMPESAFQPDAPASRPRLSRTVTLGQTESGYPEPQGPATAPPMVTAPTVVVNNNVVVYAGGTPGYYGGYYGGYGGYAGYGHAAGTVPAPGGAGGSFGGYSNTGPTTAAPGHTPGVGGNWSPAPSYGPRQMR